MSVEIDQLETVVSFPFHLGNGQDERFRAQVHPEHAVGRICVGCDHRLVVRSKQPCFAGHFVERPLVFRVVLVNDIVPHGLVIHDHGETVEVGFLRDVLGFLRRDVALGSTRIGRFFAGAQEESRREDEGGE